ncbi:MAG: HAMP domain-containing sensor histidine kinase [Acidobacteriota bacterium]
MPGRNGPDASARLDDALTPGSEEFTADDLGEMVLRLAHEIRNPLATIKSGAQLVQHLIKPQGEILDYVTSILAAVARIDGAVRDMQRFVKIEPLRPSSLDISEVVATGLRCVLHEARGGNVSLVLVSGEPVRVTCNREHLRTVVEELLSNAIRFSPPGSTVMVSWQAQDNGVLLHVDDEGPGIPAENASRILRPFFSTSTQGTGLGLTIVAKICRLCGASIEWRNLAGKGCRFTIRLKS